MPTHVAREGCERVFLPHTGYKGNGIKMKGSINGFTERRKTRDFLAIVSIIAVELMIDAKLITSNFLLLRCVAVLPQLDRYLAISFHFHMMEISVNLTREGKCKNDSGDVMTF